MARQYGGRLLRISSLAVLGCALLSPASAPASSEQPWPLVVRRIRTTRVDLDSNHLLTTWLMRGFVATGSDSPNCLVTFAEMGRGAGLVFPGPVFCAPRIVEGQEGVMVSVFFPGQDAGSDFRISLTLYHEGARFYGQAVPYSGL
jgi:hypothetical protein